MNCNLLIFIYIYIHFVSNSVMKNNYLSKKRGNKQNEQITTHNNTNTKLTTIIPGKVTHNQKDIYIITDDIYYCLLGTGKFKVIKGTFHLNGYEYHETPSNSIPEYPYTFNINPNLLYFKSHNTSPNVTEIHFEPTSSPKPTYTFVSQNSFNLINSNLLSIPKPLSTLNCTKYNTVFLTGKKNSGKSTYLPILINKYLSIHKKVYFIECDIIHPITPYIFNIALLRFETPITDNSAYISDKSLYTIIKSFYVHDTYDIETVYKYITTLYNTAHAHDISDDSVIIINSFSAWDSNASIYNALIYKDMLYNNEKGVVVYMRNSYNKSSSNEKEINYVESVLFDKKEFNSLIKQISVVKDIDEESKCEVVIVNNDFAKEDNVYDVKKGNEMECVEYFVNGSLSCGKKEIKFDKICIALMGVYVDIKELKCEEILQMFINRYCVLFKEHTTYNNNTESGYDDDNKMFKVIDVNLVNDYYEFMSFCKVIGVDIENKTIHIYYNNSNSNNNDNDDDESYCLCLDSRVEKTVLPSKKELFMKYISNISFNYNIMHNDNTTDNTTLTHNNKSLYLSRNSYNLIE